MRIFSDAADRIAKRLTIDSESRASAFLIAAAIVLVLTATVCVGPVWRLYALLPADHALPDRLDITRQLAGVWLRESPDVLFLGGSHMRELMPDDHYVGQELSAACSQRITVFNAASSSQPFETSWAIADRFRSRPPRVVFIAANIFRTTHTSATVMRAGRSLMLLPEAERMPGYARSIQAGAATLTKIKLGIAFTDSATALGYGRGSIKPYVDEFNTSSHGYRAPGLPSELKLMEANFQLRSARALPDDDFERNIDGHAALVRALAAEGVRVVTVFTPSSPEATPVLAALEPKVAYAKQRFAVDGDVLDLTTARDLDTTDFYDRIHLLGTGRQKLWPKISPALVSALRCDARAVSE